MMHVHDEVCDLKARLIKLGLLVGLCSLAGCFVRDVRWQPVKPPSGTKPQLYRLVTTAYCPCRECCSWTRNWYGKAVISSGPNKGKAKAVGITANGSKARYGTIAADTSVFPFGTVMYIPGYGYGIVEDRGGDIKGYHIDLYYSSHQTAKEWGKVKKDVKVWMPARRS